MKKKLISILVAISIGFNVFGQATVLTAPGSETFDPAGWLKMIDELGQMYDLITYNITQIENQYKQIENYVNAAKGIDWSNIEFDGDFDIRNDIKDANKKINKLITQARNIRDTLEKPSINCGTKKYSIKDLVGGNGYDNNIFAAVDTMKTYMTTEMESAIDGMVNGLTDKEKKAIWNKYGISPKNYLFIQQSMNQIKSASGDAIGKAAQDALDLIRAQKVTETNNILKAAYNSLDQDGNITEGAARESLLLMSEQVVDGLMSLEEAMNEVNRLNALKLIEEQAKEEAKAAHQAEVEVARRSLDSMTPSMFRKMGTNGNEWIDVQVCEAIDYFSMMLNKIGTYIRSLATLFGVLGLLWAAFKLLNSRITVKDLWWDVLYKWLSFIVLVNLYVPLCSGILWCANYFGTNLGLGKEALVENLKNIKTETELAVQGYTDYCDGLVSELENKFPDTDFLTFQEFIDENDFDNSREAVKYFVDFTYSSLKDGYDTSYALLDKKAQKANKQAHALSISKDELKEYKRMLKDYKKDLDKQNFYSTKLLESLDRILIIRGPDGQQTDNLSDSYFDINLYLKDSNGNETVYIAPSSLLRLGIFCAQLFWEQSQFDPVAESDSIMGDDEEKPGFVKRTVENIVKELLAGVCCICIVLSICFVLLQYIMCIIEYVIICSLGFLFIPMILFDGTKELPKKLIPTLMGFFIKMLVMNVCTFFVFYLYLEFTSGMINSPGGINWATIASIFFNCLLGFVLTQNAPKIAQTLLTGQPQLSMGEAVAAGATALGAARIGSKAAKGAVHTAGGAVRGTVNGGTNVLGSGVKAAAAASSEMKNWSGGGKFFGAVKGAAGSVGRDIGEGIKSKGEDFLHGGGKGGTVGSGGAGAGGKLHGQSGTYTKDVKDLGIKAGDTISTVSNPKFQNATIYDKALETNRNMSYKEFFREKWNQGLNSVAQNESKAAENQQTKNLKDAGIGNNLANRKNENTI